MLLAQIGAEARQILTTLQELRRLAIERWFTVEQWVALGRLDSRQKKHRRPRRRNGRRHGAFECGALLRQFLSR